MEKIEKSCYGRVKKKSKMMAQKLNVTFGWASVVSYIQAYGQTPLHPSNKSIQSNVEK